MSGPTHSALEKAEGVTESEIAKLREHISELGVRAEDSCTVIEELAVRISRTIDFSAGTESPARKMIDSEIAKLAEQGRHLLYVDTTDVHNTKDVQALSKILQELQAFQNSLDMCHNKFVSFLDPDNKVSDV